MHSSGRCAGWTKIGCICTTLEPISCTSCVSGYYLDQSHPGALSVMKAALNLVDIIQISGHLAYLLNFNTLWMLS
jgi:hypothetical protein